LRFPEFTGEWRYSFLNEYLEENKERNKKGLFDKTTVLSVSGDFGIVNQIRLLGRSFAGKSVLDYHVVRYGNIVYTKSPLKEYPYGIVKINNGVDGIVSTLYAVYNVKSNASGCFIENYFALPRRTNKYFKPIVRIGAKHDMKISNEEAIANVVCFPQYAEQQKIAEFLSLIDDRIVSQNKIIEDLKKLKSAIRKKIFSLLKDEYTKSFEINQLLDYEQPTAYIVANDEYSTDTRLTPVLTANKGFILGYTDEKNGIYQKGACIIFDDFTMDAKYVSFPFKVKSSAIKILTAKPNVNLRFMFEYLSHWELKSEEHKRHYISEISPLVIELPSKEKQNIIALLMTSLNNKLTIEEKAKIRYEVQKGYLLSQMFI